MAEYIGARISLVSKSDIRYVGILHEINSQASTVALENVTSFGTEGRKENPADEIPPSSSVYDYIVFRGTDVKDLRIEETPVNENRPTNPPDDPAILQGQSRPAAPQAAPSQARQQPNPQQGPQHGQPGPGGPPFQQHPQYPPFYPPAPTGWGRGGPPGPPGPGGYPPMAYGPPPGWFPGHPGQGFPPGGFPPNPYGYPPGQYGGQAPPQAQQPAKPAPIGPGTTGQTPPAAQPTVNPTATPASAAPPKAPAAMTQNAPTPPVASKPSKDEVQAAVTQASPAIHTPAAYSEDPAVSTPTSVPRRIIPAIPRQKSAAANAAPVSAAPEVRTAPVAPSDSLSVATQAAAAAAAVAAVMAKMPPVSQPEGNAMDNLTKKVNEMRTNDHVVRAPAQPGRGAGFGGRSNRGGRGGRSSYTAPSTELPGSDFDFETANAKFIKEDLVKEASPLVENEALIPSPTGEDTPVIGYNKKASFFDNISSESKDRMEGGSSKAGGREWRGEEQKKNVETFGQGSVDNGYRGGFRGRGRGRGRGGFRGRGYSGNGQPQPRGNSSYRGRDAQTFA